MILSYCGHVEINGTKNELYAEFGTIITTMLSEGVVDEEELHSVVKQALSIDKKVKEGKDYETILMEAIKEKTDAMFEKCFKEHMALDKEKESGERND